MRCLPCLLTLSAAVAWPPLSVAAAESSSVEDLRWTLDDILGGMVGERTFLADFWQKQPFFTDGHQSGSRTKKIRRLMGMADLEVLEFSPAFDSRSKEVIRQQLDPNARKSQPRWQPAAVPPVQVTKQGFGMRELKRVGGMARSAQPAGSRGRPLTSPRVPSTPFNAV